MKRFPSPQTRLLGVILIVAALATYGWAVHRGWGFEPTDAHSSRQAQTAITAQMLEAQGLPPLTPFNGLGPPWNVPMEFPTYQLLTAAVAKLTGADIISAGRMVGVGGTLLLLPALGLILRRIGLGFTSYAAAVALLLTAPLWIVFSRAVLIESLAAALATWWFAGLGESLARADRSRKWLTFTAALGILAALTKVTTFAVLLPAGAVMAVAAWQQFGRPHLLRAALATVPGIIAAVLWHHYADSVKFNHPYANFLTSENLGSWNWGTWDQRTDPAWWARIFAHLNLVFPWWWWGLVLVGGALGTGRQRAAIALALSVLVTGPLAFANLYYVHNYYFMAIVPAAIAAVAVAWGAGWQRWAGSRAGRAGLVIGLLAMLGGQVAHYRDGLGRGQVRDRPLPELGLIIRDLSTPADHIFIIGREWDPLLTYTIGRPLTFVREDYETDEDAWQRSRAALAPRDYTVLVATDSVAGDTAYVHHRARELGLLTEPIVSTAQADIYVSAEAGEALKPRVAEWRATGRVLAGRPDRMGPGETRREFITAAWQPFDFGESGETFKLFQPLPSAVFTRHQPAVMAAFDQEVLHLHPPAGLRFPSLSRPRTISMAYGLLPEIWQQQHDSDGVRFRFFARGPDGRQRLIWSEFVQPISHPDHRQLRHAEVPLPADHELELWIDAGPDHNPGYDWSIIANLRIE